MSTASMREAPCHAHAPLLMRSVTPTASSTFITSYSRLLFTPRRSANTSTGTEPRHAAVETPPAPSVPAVMTPLARAAHYILFSLAPAYLRINIS